MSSDSAGFLEFKLDYSGTKSHAIGEVVYSKHISAGGHVWRINCYPRGLKTEDQGEYLSIFLELMGESKNVRAIFDVFAMGRDGTPSSSHGNWWVKVYPPEGARSWGYHQFMKRSDLDLYVTNGWAAIMCVVIVVRDDDPLDVPPSDIGTHLGHLLDYCPDTSDVSFVVGGETFPAHRAVLAARSPVFKAQLFGSMADAKMPSIVLHDIAPTTFNAMLRFVYTDSLPRDDPKFEDLLAVADRYALDRLKLLCARKLWDSVSVDTVATTLACAETYNCTELKTKCIGFFAEEKNFKKAVFTDGFVQLVQKFPSIFAELKEKVGA